MQHHVFFTRHPVHFFSLQTPAPCLMSNLSPSHPYAFPYFIPPSQSLLSLSTCTIYAASNDSSIPSTTFLTNTHSAAHPFYIVLALSLRSFILTTSQAPSLLPSPYTVTQVFSWGRFRTQNLAWSREGRRNLTLFHHAVGGIVRDVFICLLVYLITVLL